MTHNYSLPRLSPGDSTSRANPIGRRRVSSQLAVLYLRTKLAPTASATPVNTARPAFDFTVFSARLAKGTTLAVVAGCLTLTLFLGNGAAAVRLVALRRAAAGKRRALADFT